MFPRKGKYYVTEAGHVVTVFEKVRINGKPRYHVRRVIEDRHTMEQRHYDPEGRRRALDGNIVGHHDLIRGPFHNFALAQKCATFMLGPVTYERPTTIHRALLL